MKKVTSDPETRTKVKLTKNYDFDELRSWLDGFESKYKIDFVDMSVDFEDEFDANIFRLKCIDNEHK